MPGLAPDAPNRVTEHHREASAPRSPPHEADISVTRTAGGYQNH